MKKPVIAVDGFSSTGKSSISKIIATKLNLVHLDTGALYRAITFYALTNCLDSAKNIDLNCLFEHLNQINLSFKEEQHQLKLFLNGENVEPKLRLIEVNNQVSFIAKQPKIRAFLLSLQQNIAKNGGVIMDGRDIGNFVLPDADFKFFLTASVEVRTERRYQELLASGIKTDKKEVEKNLLERDKIDSERSISPLTQAEDAILIDNTFLNKDETVELMIKHITNS